MNEAKDGHESGLLPSRMSAAQFLDTFGGVYEHSPWVGEAVLERGLDTAADTPEGLSALMSRAVAAAPESQQLALLQAHPDLAGKLALAGEMTASSVGEQASAGLDRCTPQELERFQRLNAAYTAKFGFPFIVAVRGMDRHAILECFEARVEHTREAEFAEALRQVDKIAFLRLADIFRSSREDGNRA